MKSRIVQLIILIALFLVSSAFFVGSCSNNSNNQETYTYE